MKGVKKYRKKKCTESQQLNYSMQYDPTEEIQNKQVKENNTERKRAVQRNVREGFVRRNILINTFKYHVFAPMGRFQLELIYLFYFPPSSHQIYVCFCPAGL